MDNNKAQKKLLFDIKSCVDSIENYLGARKSFASYNDSPLLQDAIERNIITIGEAMNAILKLNPDIEISNSRRIVNARNKPTHGYDEIYNTQIWNIIIKHIPVLKVEIQTLLNE